MKYLFAFSQYHTHAVPTYYAVCSDFSLFISNDWDAFYKETGLYCAHSIKHALIGEYKPDEKFSIYTHASYTHLFVVDFEGGKIKLVSENEIEYYERESDPEAQYYAGVATYNERNSY